MQKISEKWLREWIDPGVSINELAEHLTNLGLEVDGVTRQVLPGKGAVIAEVTSIDSHPNSQKLTICKVTDGTSNYDVVCGAPNVTPGLRTALVRVGGELADGTKIVKQKIGGFDSNGMLCSNVELGYGADSGKIVEFAPDTALGTSLSEVVGFDDVVIEIDLTPNRGDCFSIRGVAREVALVNQLKFNDLEVKPVEPKHYDIVPIELDDPVGCPRYLGRVIKRINPHAITPEWMVQRLISSGLRPIGPVVDVTNYVMLELGQPLHAFDLELVKKGIKVRKAEEGETIVLLDGREVELTSEMLLITDGITPVAVAGVMGGEHSGIQTDTTDIFIECAYFDPLVITGTARTFGIQTDASTRYERGVDYELQHKGMERVTQLLLDIVGGSPGPVIDAFEPKTLPQRRQVEISFELMDRLVGESLDQAEVTGIFERLGLQPVVEEDSWKCTVPSHRFDISIPEDLVEEVVRVHGYNEIGSKVPSQQLNIKDELAQIHNLHDLKQAMSRLGYFEVITYSFISRELNGMFLPELSPLGLQNPISEDKASMRKSLIPGLLGALQYNLDRVQEDVRLFESGMCFRDLGNQVEQETYLSGVQVGCSLPENWTHIKNTLDFFDVKGDIQQFGEELGVPLKFAKTATTPSHFHPGQTATISVDGIDIGFVGRLHPTIEEKVKMEAVYAFEIAVSALLKRRVQQFVSFSHFPATRRDIALLLDEEVTADNVEQLARENLGSLLEDFRIFDLYDGEGIEEGKKSLAIGLTLRDLKKTLKETEVTEVVDNLVREFSSKLGAERR